jgi:hypothetical protein
MTEQWRRLNRVFLHFITRGRYKTYEIEDIRRIKLLNFGTSLGIFMLLVLGSVAFIEGITPLWPIDYCLAAALFLILLSARQTQNYWFGLYAAIGFYTLMFTICLFTSAIKHGH